MKYVPGVALLLCTLAHGKLMPLLLFQLADGSLLFAFIEKLLLRNLLNVLGGDGTNRNIFSGWQSLLRLNFSISQLLGSLDTRLKVW